MFSYRDKGKNKKSITGVKNSKWPDFIEKGLKLMGLLGRSKEVSFAIPL